MISGNYTNYNNQMNNISYGAVKNVVPQQITQKLPENIQNLDAEQIASQNGAVSAAQGANAKTFIATLPMYASFIGLRSLSDTKTVFGFAGDYDKTFLGKLSKAGDKVANTVGKIIPGFIKNGIPKQTSKLKAFMLKHSAAARSLTTPLRLENSMALSEANGLFGRAMMDNSTMFEKGFEGDVVKLFKDDTSSFWKFLKGKGIETTDPASAKKIVVDAFRELGEKPVNDTEIKKITKDIINTLSKSDDAIEIVKWGKVPVGKIPLLGRALKLKVPMSEIANKLRVSANVSGEDLQKAATGAKAVAATVGTTALGRMLPNAFSKIYESLTSNYIGGKLAPLLQAYFLASAAVKASEAPKGQKLATFMDEEAGAVSVMFATPLATSVMKKAGGLKYIGMGKTVAEQQQNVAKYRDLIEALNKKVDAGTISYGEYAKEAKEIKNVLKGKTRFWQKPLKFIGKILGSNYDRETIKPFLHNAPQDYGAMKTTGLNIANKVQNFLYKFKTGKLPGGITPGGLLRFAIVFFALSPVITKPFQKLINKIFGKPYNPDEANKQQTQNGQEQVQNPQNNPFANMTEAELNNLLSKNQNLLMQIQNDPALMQEIEQNPQKLYDLLQQGANAQPQVQQNRTGQTQNNQTFSPMLQNRLQNNQNMPAQQQNQPMAPMQMQRPMHTQQPLNNQIQKMPTPSVQNQNETNNNNPQTTELKRTYIPSSKPNEEVLKSHQVQQQQFDSTIAEMDATIDKYSQYLN